MKNARLYPRLYRPDYLVLTRMRGSLSEALGGLRGTLLDYGCGSQPYRELLSPECAYIGADFSNPGPNGLVLDERGLLPKEDDSVDFVLSTQVLEHVKQPALYLSECHRVLRNEGSLILTTHGNWPYHPSETVGDYWRWTLTGLCELIEANGFCVHSVRASCEGKLSLIQQLLALSDPARTSRAYWRRVVRAGWSLGWNLFGLGLEWAAPGWTRAGDILPVVYVVVARKRERTYVD